MSVHNSFNPHLIIPVAVAVVGSMLSQPANVISFVAALGIGIAIGWSAIVERVGRARTKAFVEWDEANRNSSLKQLEEANAKHNELKAEIEKIRMQLIETQNERDLEKIANDKLRSDLMGVALRVLHERGHVEITAHLPAIETPEDL